MKLSRNKVPKLLKTKHQSKKHYKKRKHSSSKRISNKKTSFRKRKVTNLRQKSVKNYLNHQRGGVDALDLAAGLIGVGTGNKQAAAKAAKEAKEATRAKQAATKAAKEATREATRKATKEAQEKRATTTTTTREATRKATKEAQEKRATTTTTTREATRKATKEKRATAPKPRFPNPFSNKTRKTADEEERAEAVEARKRAAARDAATVPTPGQLERSKLVEENKAQRQIPIVAVDPALAAAPAPAEDAVEEEAAITETDPALEAQRQALVDDRRAKQGIRAALKRKLVKSDEQKKQAAEAKKEKRDAAKEAKEAAAAAATTDAEDDSLSKKEAAKKAIGEKIKGIKTVVGKGTQKVGNAAFKKLDPRAAARATRKTATEERQIVAEDKAEKDVVTAKEAVAELNKSLEVEKAKDSPATDKDKRAQKRVIDKLQKELDTANKNLITKEAKFAKITKAEKEENPKSVKAEELSKIVEELEPLQMDPKKQAALKIVKDFTEKTETAKTVLDQRKAKLKGLTGKDKPNKLGKCKTQECRDAKEDIKQATANHDDLKKQLKTAKTTADKIKTKSTVSITDPAVDVDAKINAIAAFLKVDEPEKAKRIEFLKTKDISPEDIKKANELAPDILITPPGDPMTTLLTSLLDSDYAKKDSGESQTRTENLSELQTQIRNLKKQLETTEGNIKGEELKRSKDFEESLKLVDAAAAKVQTTENTLKDLSPQQAVTKLLPKDSNQYTMRFWLSKDKPAVVTMFNPGPGFKDPADWFKALFTSFLPVNLFKSDEKSKAVKAAKAEKPAKAEKAEKAEGDKVAEGDKAAEEAEPAPTEPAKVTEEAPAKAAEEAPAKVTEEAPAKAAEETKAETEADTKPKAKAPTKAVEEAKPKVETKAPAAAKAEAKVAEPTPGNVAASVVKSNIKEAEKSAAEKIQKVVRKNAEKKPLPATGGKRSRKRKSKKSRQSRKKSK